MGNLLKGDNVKIKYYSISSTLMFDIPSFFLVFRHNGPAYLPECNEIEMRCLIQRISRNVTEC